jgi:alcohol dehydrogenase YqhD (iron-dependent ADH family)
VLKEVVDIGPEVIKPGWSHEFRSLLMIVCSMPLSFVTTLRKEGCCVIIKLGHQLPALYDIDHGASLSLVAPAFLENPFQV